MNINEAIDFDPGKGYVQAPQGDAIIIPIPAEFGHIKFAKTREIPRDKAGRLCLVEGELTGHHHAIDLLPPKRESELARRMDRAENFGAVDRLMADALAGEIPLPTAKLYEADKESLDKLVNVGFLTRTDLVVGLLEITVGPMCLEHPEHGSIRIPPGDYLVSRQVESAGAEERRVAD